MKKKTKIIIAVIAAALLAFMCSCQICTTPLEAEEVEVTEAE